MSAAANNAYWFSENSGKAWAEKWFLIYSPVWMAMMAVVMFTGLSDVLGDVGFIVLGLLVALPFWVVPALKSPENSNTKWYETYWFKANMYMLSFGFFGNYVGSEYFFDILGMVYIYPSITWNLDTALVGSGTQKVPVLMYLLTHAYFMTYHTSAIVVLRRFRTSGIKGMVVLFPIMVFVIGYFWSFMETKAMANPLIAGNFYYEKMDLMLAYGSAIYAIYFVCSFPIYYFIDENSEKKWSLWQTLSASCCASLLTFYGLDIAAHLMGSL